MRLLLDIANFGLIQIIVFGCLSMGGYYFFAFDDGNSLKESLSNMENQISQVEISIKKKEKEFLDLEIFKKEILLKEKSVNYFLNYIPNQLSSIDVFSLLNSEAKVAGINIEDKQDQPSLQKDSYEVLQIKLRVSGAFPQLVLFLSRLTDQKRILVVDNISMNISNDKKLIMADLNILAFRYNEQEQKKEDKSKG